VRPSIFPTAEASAGCLEEIRRLLDGAFAREFSDDDWEHTLGGWHVTAMEGNTPVSHAAVVPRRIKAGGRSFRTGYVEGVATLPERQGQGLGSLVMSRVERLLRQRFELGALSTGLHAFYERLGWERWRGPTFVQRSGNLLRTEEDDDSVMVLRFGPSLDLDLASPISCEARKGDIW
jgi:aminoglycoside 2'-N-acetyltransferase I